MADNRATCWSVTINNPTAQDEELLHQARQKGWRIDGQREVGQEGTPHYQLIVHTPQVRFSALKKLFPRGHIEVARNRAALATYVQKEETRAGSLPTSQELYPSQAKYFDLVWDVILADPTKSEFKRASNGLFINPKNALIFATKELIKKGYMVENVCCNPMTIQAWTYFHPEFLIRKTNRQTDTTRVQDDTNSVAQEDITTNHADDAAQS